MSEDNHKLEQESEDDSDSSKPKEGAADNQSSLPLFLRNKSEGNRDNAQDEKDGSDEYLLNYLQPTLDHFYTE